MTSHFESLDILDMEDVIQEGIRLLTLLEEKFKHNINILVNNKSILKKLIY